jgi:predicted nucleic-acid-binding Zn-ribbon protein
MPINEQQLQKLNNWLKSKNVNMLCPSCGRNAWEVADIVVAPQFAGGIILGGQTVPMVQLICKNCFYVRLYAAVPIGLLEERKEPTIEKPAEKTN